MPDQPEQNYANHQTFDKSLYVITVLLLVAIILAMAGAFMGPGYIAVAIVCVCVGVVGVMFRMRAYATRVQDRIIRLEMRLRLGLVLPDDLKQRIPELTLTQLIGLRFASDAELPDLTQKALAGSLTQSDDIKKQVKSWQADYLRV